MSATRAIFMDKIREKFMLCRGGFENGCCRQRDICEKGKGMIREIFMLCRGGFENGCCRQRDICDKGMIRESE